MLNKISLKFISSIQKKSYSKYITIIKGNKEYRVRFSQHSYRNNYKGSDKLADLEIGGDTPTITTTQAIEKVMKFFEE